jgi:hypothetical protein
MPDQLENEMSQPKTMTPQELRESLLTELEAGKQALTELSDEEVLEAITGGGLSRSFSAPSLGANNPQLYHLLSAPSSRSEGNSPLASSPSSSPMHSVHSFGSFETMSSWPSSPAGKASPVRPASPEIDLEHQVVGKTEGGRPIYYGSNSQG